MTLDFGYPWWLSYGHLAILAPASAALLAGLRLRWRTWIIALLGAVALWSAVSVAVTRSFNANGMGELPTDNFFKAGQGKVLDIGAGTGRSSVMLLRARPQATLVATDLFGASFEQHFGHDHSPQDRLQENLKAAGVADRASIETADMRQLPFADASFDAAISAYAMDHLNRDGSSQALREAARVLKPGGDFLLILVGNDGWTKFAYGPLLTHGGVRGSAWWTARAREAGFRVMEEGRRTATLYLVLRREPSPPNPAQP